MSLGSWFVRALACALCGLSLSHAANLPGPWKVFPGAQPAASAATHPSPEITLRVFVDATSSMRGFVTRNNSAFAADLQTLERAAHQMSSDLKATQCFEFGTKPIPAKGPPCYEDVLHPSFFALPRDQDKTKIESVVSGVRNDDSLTVIVTDLFEDEADLGALFDVFKKYVFEADLSLGVVASKQSFDGEIYDIGPEHGSEHWAHSRPYYALVVGKSSNVTAYFTALQSVGIKEQNLLILSRRLLQQPVSWKDARPAASANVALDPSFIQVAPGEGSFGVLRLHEGECKLDLQLNAVPAPFRPSIDWNKVGHAPQIKRFLRNSSSTVTVDLNDGAVTVSIKPDQQGQHPLLQMGWTPDRIRPSGFVYVEQVMLRIDRDSTNFDQTPFIEEWNAIPAAGQAAKFDGGKTQYLSELITGLWQSLLRSEPPDIGSVYIYFQP